MAQVNGEQHISIVDRIACLIEEEKVSPTDILVLTFTNKAAGEIKERLVQNSGDKGRQVRVTTFYSLCTEVLRKHIDKLGYSGYFVVYTDEDREGLLKKVSGSMGAGETSIDLQAIMSSIEDAKAKLIDAGSYSRSASSASENRLASVYAAYQDEMKRNNALDFNDVEMLIIMLFTDYPEVLQEYQDRYRNIVLEDDKVLNYAQTQMLSCITH